VQWVFVYWPDDRGIKVFPGRSETERAISLDRDAGFTCDESKCPRTPPRDESRATRVPPAPLQSVLRHPIRSDARVRSLSNRESSSTRNFGTTEEITDARPHSDPSRRSTLDIATRVRGESTNPANPRANPAFNQPESARTMTRSRGARASLGDGVRAAH